MNRCTCGESFRDGEDYRDHLPCPGTPVEQAAKRDRAAIVRWHRSEAARFREIAQKEQDWTNWHKLHAAIASTHDDAAAMIERGEAPEPADCICDEPGLGK